MKQFMDKDFLLSTETAKILYHQYAAKMPIIDYHCHINPREIAEDKNFDNITQVWLGGDHYKWRLMRSNGIDEKYITGDASDRDKFGKWTPRPAARPRALATATSDESIDVTRRPHSAR
jgi:glucuronate isomerase